jgi:hypothetical protein
MKGGKALEKVDVWFDNKDHPGTKDLRRVIRFVVEDYEDEEYNKEIFKDIEKELRGRGYFTGDTLETTIECSSSDVASKIGEAYEVEKKRRINMRRKRKRQREDLKYTHHDDQHSDTSNEDSDKDDDRTIFSKISSISKKKKDQRRNDTGSTIPLGEDRIDDQEKNARANKLFRRLVDILWFLLGCGLAAVISLAGLGYFSESEPPQKKYKFVDPWYVGGANASLTANATSIRWSSDGRMGLDLEVLNAADEYWEQFIFTALNDWNNGDPIDPLRLSITKVDRDIECVAVDKKIKICNGDYGETEWRGLNDVQFFVETNEIVASAAKLNDFYLENEPYAQKLYTVCHEFGHGFGLPHWDENFLNQDLYNCMDYTISPQYNNRPDTPNFYYLAQLYGDTKNKESTASNPSSRKLESRLSKQIQNDDTLIRQSQILHSDDHFEVYAGMIDDERGLLRYYLLS